MKTKFLAITAVALSGAMANGHIFLGTAGFNGDGTASVVAGPGVGQWTATYDVELEAATAGPGTYFVLFDYPGYVSHSHTLGADWTVTAPLLGGMAPFGPVGPDNPSVNNIYGVYTGAGVSDPTGGTPLLLGTLSIVNSLSGTFFYPGPNFNAVVSVKPPIVGFPAQNTLNIQVPVPEGSTVFSMIGLGVLGAGYFVRRRMVA